MLTFTEMCIHIVPQETYLYLMSVVIIFHIRAGYKDKFQEWCNNGFNFVQLGNFSIAYIILNTIASLNFQLTAGSLSVVS
jgi:hypothetical protein